MSTETRESLNGIMAKNNGVWTSSNPQLITAAVRGAVRSHDHQNTWFTTDNIQKVLNAPPDEVILAPSVSAVCELLEQANPAPHPQLTRVVVIPSNLAINGRHHIKVLDIPVLREAVPLETFVAIMRQLGEGCQVEAWFGPVYPVVEVTEYLEQNNIRRHAPALSAFSYDPSLREKAAARAKRRQKIQAKQGLRDLKKQNRPIPTLGQLREFANLFRAGGSDLQDSSWGIYVQTSTPGRVRNTSDIEFAAQLCTAAMNTFQNGGIKNQRTGSDVSHYASFIYGLERGKIPYWVKFAKRVRLFYKYQGWKLPPAPAYLPKPADKPKKKKKEATVHG